MEASQLTPSQVRFIEEAKARRARFARHAKPDTPIICLSASARSRGADVPPEVEPEPIPQDILKTWVRRQIDYRPWFSIEGEITPSAPRLTVFLAPGTVTKIQRICCDYYDVSMDDLMASHRFAEAVRARHVAMFLAKEFTNKSLPEIGRRFGNKDHTTVLHAFRRISKFESQDGNLAADLRILRERVREACA